MEQVRVKVPRSPGYYAPEPDRRSEFSRKRLEEALGIRQRVLVIEPDTDVDEIVIRLKKGGCSYAGKGY